MAGSESRSTSLADRLNHLFATIKGQGRRAEYSNEEVARAMTAAGVPISQSYIWLLRKGKKDNPTIRHVKALADFFGVPPAYFFDEDVTHRVNQRLAELKAENERLVQAASYGGEIQLMAARAGELSPEGLGRVVDLVNVVYELEQLKREGA
jgi:transcriptional regulator with XRE-family HTH domain